jgi:cystathionine beta-lyase
MDSIFDEVINREHTGCAKYDSRKSLFGNEDVIPLWVADMDFRAPEEVIRKLQERVAHGIYGYPVMPDHYFDPIVNWIDKRYHWKVEKEWICFSPGVVPALSMAVLAYTDPGDGIVVQPPVYFPFYRTIEGQKRRCIENPLQLKNKRYHIDFDDLKKKVGEGARMIFLCNPHNPGGSVWRKEELEELASICMENQVTIISDEIHSDIIYSGYKHIPIASIDREIAANVITCMAPSKTFNLAGLASSFVIIPDEARRNTFKKILGDFHIHHGNVFGLEAMKTAYESGETWLESLLKYLEGNAGLISDFLERKLPQIKAIRPEGTYLSWLDFSALNMDRKTLNRFVIEKAGLGLSDGEIFGTGGRGFQRLNFACPRAILKKSLEQLCSAVKEIN